jgi:hypothetical protein
MKLVGATIVSTTLVLLGSLGCGGAQDTPTGGSSSGGSSGQTSACPPEQECYARCLCETHESDIDGCVNACRQDPTGGAGGTGAVGAGGTVSSGGTGTSTGGTGAVVGSGGTGTSTGGVAGTAGVAGTGGTTTGTREIIELKMQPFTVGAGQEAFACQNFANPGGADMLVFVQTESFMSTGSHHMFVMEGGNNQNGPLETEQTNPQGCNGLQFSSMIHSAQTPQVIMKYPPGIGAKLNAGIGIRMIAHYYNTTTGSLTPDVRVLLYKAFPGEVNQLAGFLFGNLIGLRVGAGQMGSAHGTWTMPYDIGMLNFVSHMHSHAINFVANVNGQQLYQTTEWDAPTAADFTNGGTTPPKQITGGSVIDWTCSYDNTSGTQALTFGESAKTNEMCIINGRVITPNGDPLTLQSF